MTSSPTCSPKIHPQRFLIVRRRVGDIGGLDLDVIDSRDASGVHPNSARAVCRAFAGCLARNLEAPKRQRPKLVEDETNSVESAFQDGSLSRQDLTSDRGLGRPFSHQLFACMRTGEYVLYIPRLGTRCTSSPCPPQHLYFPTSTADAPHRRHTSPDTMFPLADLPTGHYLIASHTHTNRIAYAGRLSASPRQTKTKTAAPLLPAPGDSDDEHSSALAVRAGGGAASYFADGADDWAFLERLDEDSPLPFTSPSALPARISPSAPGTPPSTAVDADDAPLSPLDAATPPLVGSALASSDDEEVDEDAGRVRFVQDMHSLARRVRGARGQKVFAVSGATGEVPRVSICALHELSCE